VGATAGAGIGLGMFVYFAWDHLKEFFNFKLPAPEIPQPTLNFNNEMVLGKKKKEEEEDVKKAEKEANSEEPIQDKEDNPSANNSAAIQSESLGSQSSLDTADSDNE